MGFIDDIGKYNIPTMASRFNGKPILIKKTGSLHRGDNFIEMDVNVHNFSYPTRSTLIALKESFRTMVIRAGFTIEGKDDDELPEVLLGCSILNGINLDAAADL